MIFKATNSESKDFELVVFRSYGIGYYGLLIKETRIESMTKSELFKRLKNTVYITIKLEYNVNQHNVI